MKYDVHFGGYFGYTETVEANSEEEAIEKATSIFETTDPREFALETENVEITKTF